MRTIPITSLSIDDIKWVHKTALADMAKINLNALSLEECETWRIMCVTAAMNAHAQWSHRRE